jgi:3',5'-cyclic-AMP phosphodiesterase
MPVTLPRLSRREFLKRAALAAAAVSLAPRSHAGLFGKWRDRNLFALFSDSHIAADPLQLRNGISMAANFAGCVQELVAWPEYPAAVIVNGDLAFERGAGGEYEEFGRLVAPVRALAPLHLVLGNHDDREHFWQAFPRDAMELKAVPQKQVAVFGSSRANWFLLDSLIFTLRTPGELGEAQRVWLGEELDAHSEKPAIVMVHHNPQFPKVTSGLLDTRELMEVLAPRRHVKALIFGHTHDWNVGQHESGIHFINLPPTAYPFQEGRPSGWVRATLMRHGMELELRALDKKHPQHGEKMQLRWRS